MTVTFIVPGYVILSSICSLIILAIDIIDKSSTFSGSTITLISLPACIA